MLSLMGRFTDMEGKKKKNYAKNTEEKLKENSKGEVSHLNKQRLASLSLHLGVGTQSGKAQKQKKESLLNAFKAKYPKGFAIVFETDGSVDLDR